MTRAHVDCVVRRGRFEEQHPEVKIVPPAHPLQGRWRAVVPIGSVPGEPDTTTVGALDLCHLMDDLYRIFPPDSGARSLRAANPPGSAQMMAVPAWPDVASGGGPPRVPRPAGTAPEGPRRG